MKERLKLMGSRRKATALVVVVAALLPLALIYAHPVGAASFDCTKAGTAVEKMICADAELSQLDDLLGDTYSQLLPQSTNPDFLKSEQRSWLRLSRNDCADAACLKAVYKERISALSNVEMYPRYIPVVYRVVENNKPPICDPLLDSLNTMPPGERPGGVYRPMGNKFIIEPWEPRGWPWTTRGVDTVYYWAAAFLDINNDGEEDAIFRNSTWLHNRDYYELYIDLSVEPEIKAASPLPEAYARGLMENQGPNIGRFSPFLSYVELILLRGQIFLMTGYRIDHWTEGRPEKHWVQLLYLSGDDVKRVCFFKEP